jgi:ABC-type bacteriocin/lantibiotic exporter with double-glycine peptidase domain
MLFKNLSFRLAVVATFLQQLLLAASTWSIASAGAALSSGNYSSSKLFIIGFFALALAAYIISSANELFTINLANSTWQRYVDSTIKTAGEEHELSSENNRKRISQWLSSEALSTIQSASFFYLGAISTILNILFTGAVFFMTLGFIVGSAVLASLAISFVLVFFARRKIQSLSTEIQDTKMVAVSRIESVLVNRLFGTPTMSAKSSGDFDSKVSEYFQSTKAYVTIEQVVACVPIAISVIVISISLILDRDTSATQMGMLVAVLPRSLQLLGNVHSLSIYLSQFLMIGQKMKNLDEFVTKLQRQCFVSQIKQEHIVAVTGKHGSNVSLEQLSELALKGRSFGRYLIHGPNGAGKSTFLNHLKASIKDAILISPGGRFSYHPASQSTGQIQLGELEMLLKEPAQVFLLDEWDANLDKANLNKIDQLLELASAKSMIIEVRHRVNRNESDQDLTLATLGRS